MKPTTISIIIGILILAGASFYLSQKKNDKIVTIPEKINSAVSVDSNIISSSNVSIINGVQIIDLQVKGGYSPQKTVAKAGIPTTIRFVTNNVFDCSRSVRIPSLNLSKNLPQTGSTDIIIGTQPAGTFRGSCGMGMYPFEVDFQ